LRAQPKSAERTFPRRPEGIPGRRLAAWVFALLILACLPPQARAQLTSLKIVRIALTNIGPPAASEALVRANIRVKEDDAYNRNSIDDDIRNLYATGFFLNIQVIEERVPDGVQLLYRLQGKPKITDILLTGNKKYGSSRLRKKVTSKVGDPLDERKLFSDAQEIKKFYQKSGFPKTEVKYVLSIDERAGRGTVTFEITESPKVKIKVVTFPEATAFKQKKLRSVVKTRRHWMFSWLTQGGTLKDEQLEDDKDRLAEFYREAGYIDFELHDVKIMERGPKKVEVRFVTTEGRQYKVGRVDIQGNKLFPSNAIVAAIRMGPGQTFTPGGLSKDIEAIRDLYGARGHIDSRVFARKKPNTQTGAMDLVYEIEESDKAYIEKIDIKGNVKTKDRVIRRELSVAPGEVFDMVRVKRSRARIEGLGYFERVESQPEETDVPNRRNLVVSVAEKSTGNVTFGAGFSSVDSLLGFIEVTQGNFDLFNPPWFMGGGQKMRLRAQLGTERQDYLLTFIEPWLAGRKLELSLDLYYRDLNFVSTEDFYDERRIGGRVGLRRALGSDFLIGGISYTLEEVGILDVSTNAPQQIQAEEGERLVSKIGLSLTYDTRNSYLLPTKGQKTELLFQFAGGPFGGETDFYKWEIRHARYIRGFLPGHILEIAVRGGVADTHGGADDVPLFDRWFLGGIDSLRGYEYRQVGPQADGEALGGDTYWFGSIEYSVPVIDRVRFAVFYDIGMVYQKPYSFDQTYSYLDAGGNRIFGDSGLYNDNWGLGLRLNLPIGPLRLDYGVPIHSSPLNDSSGEFQFSVGYTRDF
jgi:outer membrane protein insertion porin family